MKTQAKLFAWSKNEPIIHWVCPVRSGKVDREVIYSDLGVDSSLLCGKYTKLACYFVRGARCVLSENLCTALGFAKGTQGVLDSLAWNPVDGPVPDLSSLPAGEITTLRQPEFILIRVKDKIIPIGHTNCRLKSKRNNKVRFINFRMHPIDLLFAVTYHKLQGVTLDKLILSISKHPNVKLRLVMSSLYVGISRVHKMDEVRVLPYNSSDIEYLCTLQHDPLLADWIRNYTKAGAWRYDGFEEFEKDMLQQTKMDLALVDDLSDLTIQDCKKYITKLDILVTGTSVAELQSSLKDFYVEGREMLEADGGSLLRKKRHKLVKQLRRLGDTRKLRLSLLRSYAKRLGIMNATKLGKRNLVDVITKMKTQ